jgi:hypothetical protein
MPEMDSSLGWKWVEVLGVAAAGIGFVVWQMRDLKRAQEATRREREAREAEAPDEAHRVFHDLSRAGVHQAHKGPKGTEAPFDAANPSDVTSRPPAR